MSLLCKHTLNAKHNPKGGAMGVHDCQRLSSQHLRPQ